MTEEARTMKVTGEDIYNVLSSQDFSALLSRHCEEIKDEALTNASANLTEKTQYTVGFYVTMGFDTTQAEIKIKRTLKFPRKDGTDFEDGESYLIREADGVGETELGLSTEE